MRSLPRLEAVVFLMNSHSIMECKWDGDRPGRQQCRRRRHRDEDYYQSPPRWTSLLHIINLAHTHIRQYTGLQFVHDQPKHPLKFTLFAYICRSQQKMNLMIGGGHHLCVFSSNEMPTNDYGKIWSLIYRLQSVKKVRTQLLHTHNYICSTLIFNQVLLTGR